MLLLLNDYKKFLNLDVTKTDIDEDLTVLINDVENEVLEYLNRELATKSYTEVTSGSGLRSLLTRQYPITAVTKIEVWEYEDDNTWYQLTADDYGRINIVEEVMILLDDMTFPSGINNIRVTYTAGYTTIPYGIQKALKELVKLYFDESGLEGANGSLGISSRNRQGIIENLDKKETERIYKSIDRYRAINV